MTDLDTLCVETLHADVGRFIGHYDPHAFGLQVVAMRELEDSLFEVELVGHREDLAAFELVHDFPHH